MPPAAAPTLGLMIAELSGWHGHPFTSGVIRSARQAGANLVCFIGDGLEQAAVGRNRIYQLVGPPTVDGVVLYADLGHFVSPQEMSRFCQGLAPLPTVGNGLEMVSFPVVVTDNLAGMHQLVNHLLEHHGCRRIAFIRGPVGQSEAEFRYQAYREALAAHEIPLVPELVVVGDFSRHSGQFAIQSLVKRHIQFDAVVAATDNMALGVMEALEQQGIQVPGEVILAGFDDYAESHLLSVPLTSVRQPFVAVGSTLVNTLLRMLAGEQVPARQVLPTQLVVRWSCGCMSGDVGRPLPDPQLFAGHSPQTDLPGLRPAAIAALQQVLQPLVNDNARQMKGDASSVLDTLPAQTWDTFTADITGIAPGSFLPFFERALRDWLVSRRDVPFFQALLSTLETLVRPYLADVQAAHCTTRLLQQARLAVDEALHRLQTHFRMQVEQKERLLQDFEHAAAPILSLGDLAETAALHLRLLDVPRCALALYEQAASGEQALPENARLLLTYDENRVHYYPRGPFFPSSQLVPPDEFPRQEPFTWLVMPLSVGSLTLGHLVVEARPGDWEIYSRLRELFSSALFRAQLARQQENAQQEIARLLAEAEFRTVELAAAKEVAESAALRAQSALQETETLLQAARAILSANTQGEICQRLTAYFNRLVQADRVIIFLVNHQARSILVSFHDGHVMDDLNITYDQLEQGISGIVFHTGQPVLSLNAEDGIEPPESAQRRRQAGTGAVIVVPLTCQEQIIGTVTAINRQDQRLFTQQDVDLLMGLALQASAAIEKARLFEEVQQLATTDSLTGLLNRRRFFEQAQVEFQRAIRYNRPLSAVLVDIDNFKRVNDTYGHLAGDAVLKVLTLLFRRGLRDVDILGRYGGEEFVFLLPETTLINAREVAERLRRSIAQAVVETEQGAVTVTVSMGVSAVEFAVDFSLELLLHRADQALYEAKRLGRNRVMAWKADSS